MLLTDLIPVIQVSVSPVILISGVGLVLLSMTNRYARAIDNARHFIHKLDTAEPFAKPHIASQIKILYGRCRNLRRAIFLACISLLLTALLIGLLFVFTLFHLEMALVLVLLFAGSMLALAGSLVALIVDINLSLGALSVEVNHHLEKTS